MNGLDTLKVPDPAMFDNYDVGGWTPPPQAKQLNGTGKLQYVVYTLRAPSADQMKFPKETKAGKPYEFLALLIDGFVETGSGYVLGQQFLSAKPYDKYNKAGEVIGQRQASKWGDYFRAHGLQVRPPTAEEYKQLTSATAGHLFKATLDWEAYDTEASVTVQKGWETFPPDPENPNQKLPYVTVGDRRIWAKAVVKRYIDQL